MLINGTWHSPGVLVAIFLSTILSSERSQASAKKSSQLAVDEEEADPRVVREIKITDKHFMAAVIWNIWKFFMN